MQLKNILPSRNLSGYLSQKYLSLPEIDRFRTTFLSQKPFPYLEFKNFFRPEKLISILKALAEEQFHPQQADLFQFKQTGDWSATKNTVMRNSPKANFCDARKVTAFLSVLQEFRAFLSSPEFVAYLSYITSTNLKPKVIDMSGTLYEDTDYLLCHDDQLEGRKIAYFLYLSDLDKNDGGALNLFSSKDGIPMEVGATIIPKFNTFSFFLVSEKSFHEVTEVVRKVQRIAVSGWFHDQ